MGIGYSTDNSVPLKNNQKIELTFKNIFKTSDKEKLKKLKKLAVSNKTKKYIEKYANLWYLKKKDFPKDFDNSISNVKLIIKIIKLTGKKIKCNGILKIKGKNNDLTQDSYSNFISDDVNGPFETTWDTSPSIGNRNYEYNMIHLVTPSVKYLK